MAAEFLVGLLKLIDATADVFPPLKSVTAGALYVVDLVQVSVCSLFLPRWLNVNLRDSKVIRRNGEDSDYMSRRTSRSSYNHSRTIRDHRRK